MMFWACSLQRRGQHGHNQPVTRYFRPLPERARLLPPTSLPAPAAAFTWTVLSILGPLTKPLTQVSLGSLPYTSPTWVRYHLELCVYYALVTSYHDDLFTCLSNKLNCLSAGTALSSYELPWTGIEYITWLRKEQMNNKPCCLQGSDCWGISHV